jgi:hypothetical protein
MNEVWELLFKLVSFDVAGLPAATVIGGGIVAIGLAGLWVFGRPDRYGKHRD